MIGSFVIVLREAFEAALVLSLMFAFLKKIGHARDQAGPVWAGTAAAVAVSIAVGTIVGGLLGLAAAVALGVAFYRGSLRMDLGRFFLVTGLLVIVFAAYLLAGGLHELGEAGAGEAGEVGGVI